MDFEKTIGKNYKFYGVHDTAFKIGPHVFDAVEDPDDGYRSYMQCVDAIKDERLVFLGKSFATVEVVECGNDGYFEGYVLRDADTRHVWLRFGTDHADDYYPMFVFEYKTPRHREVEELKDNTKLPANWFYDNEIRTLQHSVCRCINNGELDEAEQLIKRLQKVVDSRSIRH